MLERWTQVCRVVSSNNKFATLLFFFQMGADSLDGMEQLFYLLKMSDCERVRYPGPGCKVQASQVRFLDTRVTLRH